jgi:hypothetical protein
MRLLSTLYPDRIVGSREHPDRTVAWLRLPNRELPAEAAAAEVRRRLADHGVTDGVTVAPYQPRPRNQTHNPAPSPWRTQRSIAHYQPTPKEPT